MSNVSESLRSLTKNEQMSESSFFLSELLIRSFLDKKRAIHSENHKRIPSPADMDTIHSTKKSKSKKKIKVFRSKSYVKKIYWNNS